MPYDPIKGQKALRTASVYERLPGSEFVLSLAELLKEADADLRTVADRIRTAEDGTRAAQRSADEARASLADFQKNGGAKLDTALKALREIAKSTKDGKAKAVAALTELEPQTP